MDIVAWIVLGAAAAATLWLIVYVKWVLPRQIEQRFLDSMSAFSRAVELRFPGQAHLAEDVEALAARLGRELGFSRERMRRLRTVARLQDIGLCALPYALINRRPSTEWTEAEQATYDRHPEIGGAMLDLVPSLRDLTEIVRCHHARFDGSEGCPLGEEIPIEARVLKVSVDYSWTCRMMGELLAQDRIFEGKGTEYSPEVVDALAGILRASRAREIEHRVA
ncbi:MAG TPA: HD domain-containing phosphohydrolase [Fimbriimonadaceae bacterium]|nr:HD domain-containing phosphohydrolase [Fimbriimonadaceae bacterium]